MNFKPTPKKYYEQNTKAKKTLHDPSFIMKAIPKLKTALKKIGVKLFIIKWSKDSISMFEDEIWREKNMEKLTGDYIYISEKHIYFASISKDGVVHVPHNLSEDKIEAFNKILITHLPGHTIGYINDKDAIKLYLSKKKNIKVDKPKVTVDFDILFSDNKLKTKSDECFKDLQTKIKKHGYIDSYDMIINNGYWNVTLNIDSDFADKINGFVKKIKTIGSHKIKKITVKIWDD